MKRNRLRAGALAVVCLLLCSGCSKQKNTESIVQTTEDCVQNETTTLFTPTERETSDAVSTEENKSTTQKASPAQTGNPQAETETEKSTAQADDSASLAQTVGSMLSYLTQTVKPDYYQKVKTDKPLEKKYTDKGSYAVSYTEYTAEDQSVGKYEIWYPTELLTANRTYPLVVMANGTGVKASSYKAIFEHLASWGFVVIGNEDENSWSGASSAKSLDFMLQNNRDKGSLFYQKIDTKNIGVAGHSQGGVGAINAVTAQTNGSYYKAMYTASTTHLVLAQALSWQYDVSKIKIPYFMTAGTLQADAGNGKDAGIAPLWSLQENYQAIAGNVPKVLARRVNTDHGDMLPYADGYMTAWLSCWLKGDAE
ncbi:MAG: hypothetical protein ACI4K9_03750, partial [Candidatus Fimenecus sp.]